MINNKTSSYLRTNKKNNFIQYNTSYRYSTIHSLTTTETHTDTQEYYTNIRSF